MKTLGSTAVPAVYSHLRRICTAGTAVLLSVSASAAITLHRGMSHPAGTYWAVEDTFLDSKATDKNFGRDFLLSAGPGKVVLVRFGDVQPWIGPTDEIKDAQLVLTQDIGAPAKLKAAYRMKTPWIEGGERRGDINMMFGRKPDADAIFMGATWAHRGRGETGLPWSMPGGLGDADVISSAKSVEKDGRVTISGLGATFERFRQVPDENYGIALVFERVSDFVSSEFRESGPNLVLTTAPSPMTGSDVSVEIIEAKAGGYLARVKNLGDKAAAFSGRWTWNGKLLASIAAQNLAAGAEFVSDVTFTETVPKHAPLGKLVFAIESNDANKSNNSLAFYPSGKPLAANPRWYNEALLPQSRFAMAVEGVQTRFNKSADPQFAPEKVIPKQPAGRFSGLWGGDTRDDGQFPRQLPMLYAPWSDQVFEQNFMPSTDLLSMSSVSFLNNGGFKVMPKGVALRCVSPFEKPLAVLAMKATYEGKEMTKIAVTGEGYASLPVEAMGIKLDGGIVELTIFTPFGESRAKVPAWQLYDAGIRAGTGVPVLTVGFPLPGIKLEPDSNLAKEKLPSDGAESFPAQLTTLTDGSLTTHFVWTKNAKWLEVDLGRDRLFGAVDLLVEKVTGLDEVLVVARETGQALPDATLFGRMVEPAWHAQNWCEQEGGLVRLRVYGVPTKARYIRIIGKGEFAVKLAEIRVIAGKD